MKKNSKSIIVKETNNIVYGGASSNSIVETAEIVQLKLYKEH